MKVAVYPGSFDPVTYGHLDIIKRASTMFDKVIVAVMCNSAKTPLFTLDEKEDIHIVIRGLRAITDFEYELQIAQTNKELSHNEVDTVFLTTNLKYSYLSSSVVREVASYGGDISKFVPPYVAELVYRKYQKGE